MAATTFNSETVNLIVDISDVSMLNKIRSAIKQLKGVRSVKTADNIEKKILSSKAFKEAMDDVKHNRIYHADSVDDMFQQILGYVPN